MWGNMVLRRFWQIKLGFEERFLTVWCLLLPKSKVLSSSPLASVLVWVLEPWMDQQPISPTLGLYPYHSHSPQFTWAQHPKSDPGCLFSGTLTQVTWSYMQDSVWKVYHSGWSVTPLSGLSWSSNKFISPYKVCIVLPLHFLCVCVLGVLIAFWRYGNQVSECWVLSCFMLHILGKRSLSYIFGVLILLSGNYSFMSLPSFADMCLFSLCLFLTATYLFDIIRLNL
jgi:hypothetical protein